MVHEREKIASNPDRRSCGFIESHPTKSRTVVAQRLERAYEAGAKYLVVQHLRYKRLDCNASFMNAVP